MTRPVGPSTASWWALDALLMLLCGGALLAAFVLSPGAERVAILGVEIPEICGFRNLTGWSCPGCGLTRSWTYLAHGELGAALRMNWLGPILFVAAILQIPISALRLWRQGRRRARSARSCPS